MSCSKWKYTEDCDGRPCPGDCDHCSFEPLGTMRELYTEALEALENISFDARRVSDGIAKLWTAIKEEDTGRVAYLALDTQSKMRALKISAADMDEALDDLITKAERSVQK